MTHRFLYMLLAMCLLVGCDWGETRSKEAQPTATTPPALSALPIKGRITCPENVRRGTFFLFAYPASIPPDPNSGGYGGNGDPIGTIDDCAAVTVHEVYWSKYNKEFYVYVVTPSQAGWIALTYVEIVSY